MIVAYAMDSQNTITATVINLYDCAENNLNEELGWVVNREWKIIKVIQYKTTVDENIQVEGKRTTMKEDSTALKQNWRVENGLLRVREELQRVPDHVDWVWKPLGWTLGSDNYGETSDEADFGEDKTHPHCPLPAGRKAGELQRFDMEHWLCNTWRYLRKRNCYSWFCSPVKRTALYVSAPTTRGLTWSRIGVPTWNLMWTRKETILGRCGTLRTGRWQGLPRVRVGDDDQDIRLWHTSWIVQNLTYTVPTLERTKNIPLQHRCYPVAAKIATLTNKFRRYCRILALHEQAHWTSTAAVADVQNRSDNLKHEEV